MNRSNDILLLRVRHPSSVLTMPKANKPLPHDMRRASDAMVQKALPRTPLVAPASAAASDGSSGSGGGDGTRSDVVPVGDGTLLPFRILHVLSYTQERKRMSVIVQHPVLDNDGAPVLLPAPAVASTASSAGSQLQQSVVCGVSSPVHLYCKGADSVILLRLRPDNTVEALTDGGSSSVASSESEADIRRRTRIQLAEWGNDGLRTLCFAQKQLDRQAFATWSSQFSAACLDLEEIRKKKNKQPNMIESLMDHIEGGLQLQGATANEDKLQPEVPETIAMLAKAGIKIWMVTGDKQETAVNIGFATRLLDETMRQVVATVESAGSAQAAMKRLRIAAKRMRSERVQDRAMRAEAHGNVRAAVHWVTKQVDAVGHSLGITGGGAGSSSDSNAHTEIDIDAAAEKMHEQQQRGRDEPPSMLERMASRASVLSRGRSSSVAGRGGGGADSESASGGGENMGDSGASRQRAGSRRASITRERAPSAAAASATFSASVSIGGGLNDYGQGSTGPAVVGRGGEPVLPNGLTGISEADEPGATRTRTFSASSPSSAIGDGASDGGGGLRSRAPSIASFASEEGEDDIVSMDPHVADGLIGHHTSLGAPASAVVGGGGSRKSSSAQQQPAKLHHHVRDQTSIGSDAGLAAAVAAAAVGASSPATIPPEIMPLAQHRSLGPAIAMKSQHHTMADDTSAVAAKMNPLRTAVGAVSNQPADDDSALFQHPSQRNVVSQPHKPNPVELASSLLTLPPLLGPQRRPYALVIDEHALDAALSHPRAKAYLLYVAVNCAAVIACRARPDQKAQVVRLIRHGVAHSRTLAVGDGANDVDMITNAHVGVGIAGAEGVQAANASDYSIGRFRFLQRLLLVHGRWNYMRMCKLALYMFWKNIVFVISQFGFQFHNGFSGQKWFLELGTQSYNLLYTGLPILLLAVLDRDVQSEWALRYPKLYDFGRLNRGLNLAVMLDWFIDGFIMAAINVPIVLRAFSLPDGHAEAVDGSTPYVFMMGTLSLTNVILIVTVRMAMETNLHSRLFQVALFACCVVWIPAMFAFDGMKQDGIKGGIRLLLSSWSFWFTVMLVGVATSATMIARAAWQRFYMPDLSHVVQEASEITHDMRSIDEYTESADLARRTGKSLAEVMEAQKLATAAAEALVPVMAAASAAGIPSDHFSAFHQRAVGGHGGAAAGGGGAASPPALELAQMVPSKATPPSAAAAAAVVPLPASSASSGNSWGAGGSGGSSIGASAYGVGQQTPARPLLAPDSEGHSRELQYEELGSGGSAVGVGVGAAHAPPTVGVRRAESGRNVYAPSAASAAGITVGADASPSLSRHRVNSSAPPAVSIAIPVVDVPQAHAQPAHEQRRRASAAARTAPSTPSAAGLADYDTDSTNRLVQLTGRRILEGALLPPHRLFSEVGGILYEPSDDFDIEREEDRTPGPGKAGRKSAKKGKRSSDRAAGGGAVGLGSRTTEGLLLPSNSMSPARYRADSALLQEFRDLQVAMPHFADGLGDDGHGGVTASSTTSAPQPQPDRSAHVIQLKQLSQALEASITRLHTRMYASSAQQHGNEPGGTRLKMSANALDSPPLKRGDSSSRKHSNPMRPSAAAADAGGGGITGFPPAHREASAPSRINPPAFTTSASAAAASSAMQASRSPAAPRGAAGATNSGSMYTGAPGFKSWEAEDHERVRRAVQVAASANVMTAASGPPAAGPPGIAARLPQTSNQSSQRR